MAQLVTGVALFVKLPAAGFGRQPEGAAPLHKAHHGFAQLAEGGRAQAGRAAGLVVQQDGGKDRFHVAAHTVAVVIEDCGHARHVGRAGVAGHQPLDHLLAKKRADVGVVKERVERGFQRLIARRIGSDGGAQKGGRKQAVPTGGQHHAARHARGVADVSRVAAVLQQGVGALAAVEVPAGENARQVADVGQCVAGQLAAVGGALFGAVSVELIQADGEQLHHLTGVVFVGLAAPAVFLLIAFGVQEQAHRRVQRDVFEQLPKVAACAAHQQVPVLGNAVAAKFRVDAVQ